jgi:hypothetical protein
VTEVLSATTEMVAATEELETLATEWLTAADWIPMTKYILAMMKSTLYTPGSQRLRGQDGKPVQGVELWYIR